MVELGPELRVGTLPEVALREGWVRARKTTGRGRELQPHRPLQRLPTPCPCPCPGQLLPVALKRPSLHAWESGLGRTLLTHGPGARGQALWASGFLAFQGGRQGGVFLGQGVGMNPRTPDHHLEEPPSLFSNLSASHCPRSSRPLRKHMEPASPCFGNSLNI